MDEMPRSVSGGEVRPQLTATQSESAHQMVGRAEVHRLSHWTFPIYELTQDGNVHAQMGRMGWFKVYMGRGQRIELADGDRWTLRSISGGGAISPVVVDAARRKVAIATLADGAYGINGKDYACSLYPAENPLVGRANRWILRHYEDELAIITRHPLSVEALLPVHLGAVFLSFFLVRCGLPDEAAPTLSPFTWGAR